MSADNVQFRPRDVRAAWPRQLCLLAVLVGLALWLAPSVGRLESRDLSVFVTLGAIGIWRWGWSLGHYIRAVFYRYVFFPHLRRRARRAVRQRGPVAELAVLATTYHEHAWITDRVVRALVREFASLARLRRAPRLVFVTGCEADDQIVRSSFEAAVDAATGMSDRAWPPELVLLRGDQGKRPALACGLRHIAEQGIDEDGVVVLMDGDSEPAVGALPRILEMFRLDDHVAAVTTNEHAVIDAPHWFAEWIKLRFGQRHLYMCSVSLSRRLLCLTGRFSAFRGSVASDGSFIAQIARDRLDHWLFGEYELFSGDDKSTWYWLAARGRRMLYVPDAEVTTYEVVAEQPLERAIANLRRWSGNMLRNSGRAIAVGPSRLGWFPWLCVLDQRISMWTTLIGPVALAFAVCFGRYDFAGCYLLWILLTRTLRVGAAWRHGSRISFYYIPMQLFSEWVGALVKVWVFFHPVKQTWLNRGNRTLDDSRRGILRRFRQGLAGYQQVLACLLFVVLVGNYLGFLPMVADLPLLWQGGPAPNAERMDPPFESAQSSATSGAPPVEPGPVFWGRRPALGAVPSAAPGEALSGRPPRGGAEQITARTDGPFDPPGTPPDSPPARDRRRQLR